MSINNLNFYGQAIKNNKCIFCPRIYMYCIIAFYQNIQEKGKAEDAEHREKCKHSQCGNNEIKAKKWLINYFSPIQSFILVLFAKETR